MSESQPPATGLYARARKSSLGFKLALLSALVTAVVVGGAFFVLRIGTEADVRDALVMELHASQMELGYLQESHLRLLLATSSLASTSPTLRASLQTLRTEGKNANASFETVQREAARVFGDLSLTLLVVTDDSGRVVASVGPPDAPRRGQSLLQLPAVNYVLRSEVVTADSSFGVLRLDSGVLQIGCVAILVDGLPIGTLLMGESINSMMLRRGTDAETREVVASGGKVLASSLDRAPVGAVWAAQESADSGLTTLAGEDYVTARLPLGLADDGRPAVLYLMRSLNASVDPILQALTGRFLIAGVLAVVLVGGAGAAVSRTALRPLSRFVSFMRSETVTTASATFNDPNAPAEIATLTDTYNGLIGSLSRERQELQRSTTELASTNETLQRQVLERERAERALRDSEEQLRQSQKLEALGALAGGVAHDFNNLLSVILGYAQIAMEELPEDSRQREDIGQINDAGQRARGLVRQLLAFSRKQVLQPQILDLNQVVTGVQALLRPLLGEDVVVQLQLAPDLARIMADPGQIEQVILNLAVNARDAMPGGGTLTIQTANIALDERHENLPLPGGPVAMLAITDTGTGMDAATRQRIFEPFFTTKPVGKGTGLGLATVYGIVRQSEGNITVYSELGQGTIFRCYFPPANEPAEQVAAEISAPTPSVGTETILVAEDESQLRALIRRALERRGYVVLEASHGDEALAVAREYQGKIDLLVTDVVMPFVSGKELAERLMLTRPDVRVLFTSGYSDEAIERHGVLTPESVFLQKPVAPDVLADAVRQLLDATPAMPGAG